MCRADGYAGVSFFVKDSLDYEIVLSEFQDRSMVRILNFKQQKQKIGAVYRDQSVNACGFLEYFDRMLENWKDCVFVGDFNFNLLATRLSVSRYKEVIESNNFSILNEITENRYTFAGGNGVSLLDHVITDVYTRDFNLTVHPSSISDHCYLNLSISTQQQRVSQQDMGTFIDSNGVFSSLSNSGSHTDCLSFQFLVSVLVAIIKSNSKTK